MRYEILVGLRYLRAKRREGFISLITVISTVGLVIGVMTLNIVLAVFTGFEEDLRDRILGFNPQLVVHTLSGTVPDHDAVVRRLKAEPDVLAAAPFVYGQAMLSKGETVVGAVVRGVGPDSEKVIALQPLLREGTVDALAHPPRARVGDARVGDAASAVVLPALILGKGVAQQLGAAVGDTLAVLSPQAQAGAAGMVPRSRRFVVVGLFDSGMVEYDGSLVYMDLAEAQRFFGLDPAVTGIEARVRDPFRAAAVRDRLQDALGFPFRVRDWMDLNHNLFSALRVGKAVYSIVLLLIVLVATFNIVSMLIMVVMEKRKDIAVLKSMGATRAGVGRIFLFKGMVIGLVGTAVGNAAAYGACLLLERYRFIELPKDVYAIDTLKVKMYPEYFLAVTAASLFLCLMAALYPARQAARLAPVDVIRYE